MLIDEAFVMRKFSDERLLIIIPLGRLEMLVTSRN